jgi:hypothetical protein
MWGKRKEFGDYLRLTEILLTSRDVTSIVFANRGELWAHATTKSPSNDEAGIRLKLNWRGNRVYFDQVLE